MIYKTLKKVSNVCQLLDKSKYPIVITNAGVTTTSNGDGSITINGTATKSSYINCTPLYPKENNGHVFYVCANNTTMSYSTWNYGLLNQSTYDNGNGVIGRTNASRERNTGIAFNKGVVFDNVIIKPQIIDLTEMYGAGNEPTTVEEFRQDFPEELYDYKPYCFVKSYKTLLKATDDKIITSYKKSLVCKTKNLFDISKVPIISGKLTVKDNSICSYGYPVVTNDPNLLSIFKSLKPDTNYTMSATTLNYLDAATNHIVLIFPNANDDKNIFYNYSAGFNKVTFSLTQEQINNITYVYFYGRDESRGGPAMWSNIQLEEGSTATEYHPYGYL